MSTNTTSRGLGGPNTNGIPHDDRTEEAINKVKEPHGNAVLKHTQELLVAKRGRELYDEYVDSEEFEDFTFPGLDEFYNDEFNPIRFRIGSDGDAQNQDGVVRGLWHSDGTALLASGAKAGKTTLVLNLINSLITGEKFLGRFGVNKMDESDKLVVFNLEVHASFYQCWLKQLNVPASASVNVQNLRGQARRINLSNKTARKKLVEGLVAYGATILIVDPLGPIMRSMGIPENDNTEVGRLLDAFNELREETNLKEILLVHHSGHEAKGQPIRPGGGRGASTFSDTPDALWTYRVNDDGERELSLTGRDVINGVITVSYDEATRKLSSESNKDQANRFSKNWSSGTNGSTNGSSNSSDKSKVTTTNPRTGRKTGA